MKKISNIVLTIKKTAENSTWFSTVFYRIYILSGVVHTAVNRGSKVHFIL